MPPLGVEAVDFDAIYSQHFDFAYRSLRLLGVEPDALEDRAQDVFGIVARRLSSFERRSSIKTWIFGIAQRVAANHRRVRRRKRDRLEPLEEPIAAPHAGPDAHADAARTARLIQAFAAGLDEERRALFVLGLLERVPVAPFPNPDFTPLSSLVRIEGEADLGQLTLPVDLPDDEREAARDELARLLASGWLDSLAGFEALEQVGNVRLNGLGVSSLEPLSNLRALTDGGLFEIRGCTALGDLSGLENLAGVNELIISCETLQSLRGFNFPDAMRDVDISAPLTDLGTFDTSRVDSLALRQTELTHLDGLASLRIADSVVLIGNLALVDVRGLDQLTGNLALNLSTNTALQNLPDFPNVSGLTALQIVANTALQNLPAFPGILASFELLSLISFSPPPPFWFDIDQVRISSNDALEQITLPRALTSASIVEIDSNPALKSLTLSDVESIDQLSIVYNPALDRLDLGALERIDILTLADTPLLPLTTFDDIAIDEIILDGP